MAKSKAKVEVEAKGKGVKMVQKDVEGLASSTNKAARASDNLDKQSRKTEKGLKGVGQWSSNSAKNFSKTTNLLGGGGRGLVGAYAALAANVFAVSAAFQFFQRAFDFQNIVRGQEALGATTGVAYKTITNSLIDATEGQLRYQEAAQATAIGTAAGLTAGQLKDLSVVAKNASLALGRDLTDSFNRLIRGTTKAEPELLDELGIILRLEPALANYAASLGKSVKDLNAFERTQAVVNEVVEQGEKKFSQLEEIMNPDAFALQQFIRSFDDLLNTVKSLVAEGLAPVFQFLTKNTPALIGALTSFALPILKSILPNFKQWEKTSKKTFKTLNKNFEQQRARVKAVAVEYKALTSVETARANAQKATQGLKPTSAGVGLIQTGQFDKLTKQQTRSLLAAAEKNKGIITKMGADMQVKYLAALRKMVQDTDKQTGRMLVAWQKMGAGVTVVLAGMRAGMTGFGAFLVKWGGRFAKGLNAAFSGVAIFGIITLLYQAGKALYEWVRGLDPAVKKQRELTEAAQESVDALKTLNEELGRARQARSVEGLLTPLEKIQNMGNALKSVNFEEKFFEILDPNRTMEQTTELNKLGRELQAIDQRLGALFINAVRNRTASPELRAEILNITNGYLQLEGAITSLPEAQKTFRDSVRSMVPSLSNLDNAIENSQVVLSNLYTQLYGADMGESPLASGINIDTLIERMAAAKGIFKESKPEEYEEFTAQLTRAYQVLRKQEAIQQVLVRQRQSQIENSAKILDNEQAAANLRTVGITFADRLANIEAERATINNAVLNAKNDEIAAQTAITAAISETQDTQSQEVVNAVLAWQNAKRRLDTEETLRDLGLAQLGISEQDIKNQERQLKLKRLELVIENQVATAQLRQQRAQSGIGQSFGIAAASESRAASENVLAQQLLLTQQQLISAESQYRQERAKGDETAIQNAETRIQQLKQTLAQQQLQLEISQNLEQSLMNQVLAETEALQIRQQGLSLNPVQQAFNEAVAKARAEGAKESELNLELLYKETEAQYYLNEAIQMQEDLYNSIQNSMTQALTGLIDGTLSFKEAFRNMAIAILQDAARMIAQMMVMRALMAAFGGGPAPAAAPGTGSSPLSSAFFANFGGQVGTNAYGAPLRNGGIMSNGVKTYASGGIASGSTSGYPAMLHGTEAIVPLPNGRSIPVEMSGSSQQNNVTVNVAIDNQGNASTNTEANSTQAGNLGNLIARAVQTELQNQKRSGGILSPYGVA